MVKDGGIVTAYDAKTGKEVYIQERAAADRRVLRLAGGRERAHLLHVAGRRGDGAESRLGAARSGGEEPEARRARAATPAIADDTLYVRTAGHLYAFGEKK